MADLRAAESAIQSHVARMSTLKINIPVNFVMPGGQFGASNIVNNVLNASTFNTNTSNNTNNAITNYYNTITNNINQINQAANRAANAAGAGRGLGRILGAMAFLREGEQILRNEERYNESTYKAHGDPTSIAEAELAHRKDYDQFAFGIGRIGRFIRETGTDQPTSEDIEHEIADSKRSERRISDVREGAERGIRLASEAEIAQTPRGYQREIKEKEAALEAENRKIEQAPDIASRRKQVADDLQFKIDEAKKEKYDDHGDWQAKDAQGNAILGMTKKDQMRDQAIEKAHQEERDASSKIDAEVTKQKADAKAKTDAELKDARDQSAYARDQADIRAKRDAAIIIGANPAAQDIAARRAEDAQKAAKYARELPADEAASRAMADKQATDLAEDEANRKRNEQMGVLALRADTSQRQLAGDTGQSRLDEKAGEHRLAEGAERDFDKRAAMEKANRAEEAVDQDKFDKDEQKREADSQDKIGEIRARGSEARMRMAGQDQQADLTAFDETQTQKIAALDNEIAHEQDAEQKKRLIAQREAQTDAQKIERAEFIAEQVRKLAAEEEQSANRVARIRADAAEYALHAEGKSWQESEARFKDSWDEKIRTAEAARDATKEGSPERRQRQAELDATQAERGEAEKAHAHDQAQEMRDRQSEIDQTELRAKGQNYTARLKGISDKANKEFEAATGNATKQAQIRRQEAADLREEQYDIRQKGPATGQAVVGSRTDLTGRYSGSDKIENLLKVNQNIETILRYIEGKLPQQSVAQ
jgi:hypothetical protein